MNDIALWILVGAAVVAALSTFSNAFLGEKGKILARLDSLDAIRDEIHAVTLTQKTIEHKLSGDLWEQQNRWTEKKSIYINLLTSVSDYDKALTAFQASVELLNQRPTEALFKTSLQASLGDFNKASSDLRNYRSYAEIFLSPEVEVQLQTFFKTKELIPSDHLLTDLTWLPLANAALRDLKQKLIKIAKTDLKLHSA